LPWKQLPNTLSTGKRQSLWSLQSDPFRDAGFIENFFSMSVVTARYAENSACQVILRIAQSASISKKTS